MLDSSYIFGFEKNVKKRHIWVNKSYDEHQSPLMNPKSALILTSTKVSDFEDLESKLTEISAGKKVFCGYFGSLFKIVVPDRIFSKPLIFWHTKLVKISKKTDKKHPKGIFFVPPNWGEKKKIETKFFSKPCFYDPKFFFGKTIFWS